MQSGRYTTDMTSAECVLLVYLPSRLPFNFVQSAFYCKVVTETPSRN